MLAKRMIRYYPFGFNAIFYLKRWLLSNTFPVSSLLRLFPVQGGALLFVKSVIEVRRINQC